MYVSKPFGGARGGGGLHHVHYVFFKKKVLSAHYVPTTCAPTTVVHRVQETKGDKIRSGCLTRTFSGAQKWAEMLHKPLHSWGSPNKEGQNHNWLPNPCLLGGHKWAEMLHNPCFLGGPQQRGTTSKHKKNKQKKTKKTFFHFVPNPNVGSCRLPPPGIEPMTLQLQRHCFTDQDMGHL